LSVTVKKNLPVAGIGNNTADMQMVIGIENLVPRSGTQLPEWNIIMAAAMMALLPPVLVILVLQRWFVKGLVETEK
jgi:sn-glycerol 3-phosphate transport system permease protein